MKKLNKKQKGVLSQHTFFNNNKKRIYEIVNTYKMYSNTILSILRGKTNYQPFPSKS